MLPGLRSELLVEDDLGKFLEDMSMSVVNGLDDSFELLIYDTEQSNKLGKAHIDECILRAQYSSLCNVLP